MRLNQLDLTAYGHFSAATLTLPEPRAGAPDLHIVYGPNEAGKSTLLSAWLDLLFGFPKKPKYAFRHDTRALRVGAELRDNVGRVYSLARVPSNQNTLLDAATDQPVAASVMESLLGGVDRAAYGTMFSLNDQTLVEGSKGIMASEGDLGQLLFQGTAGLAELGTRLAALRAQSDDWHSPRKRKTALADHKKRLADLTAARRDVDLTLGAWRKLTDAVEQAETQHARAEATQRDLLTRYTILKRDLDALPLLARLRRAETQLATLPAARDIPADWRAGLPAWQAEESALADRLPVALQDVQAAQAVLDSAQVDSAALPYLPQIDTLDQRFGAVAKELSDLPKREGELRSVLDQMQGIARRVGRMGVDPDTLILPAPLVAALSDLMTAAATLASKRDGAEAEVTRAQAALTRAQSALPDGVDDFSTLAPLADLLAQIRRDDPLRALADADAAAARARVALDRALAALAPWRGDVAALAAIDLPAPDALRALQAELTTRQDDLRAARAMQERLEQAVARGQAALGDADLPDAGDLTASRAARDAAWDAHKATLSPTTAAAFEAALHADDAHQAHALRAARMFERVETLRADQAELAGATRASTRAAEGVGAVQGRIAALWSRVSPDSARSIADLLDWLARRAAALDASLAYDQAQAAQRGAQAAMARWADALAVLVPTDGAGGFAAHLAQAQARLDKGRDSQQARAALEAAKDDLRDRTTALDSVLAAQDNWAQRWRDVLVQAGWAMDPLPDAVQMRAVLAALAELPALAAQAAELRYRMDRITQDASEFAAQAGQIAQALGEAPDPDPRLLWPRLRDRLRRAQDGAETHARLVQGVARAQAQLATLDQRKRAWGAATAPLRAAFPDQSLGQIAQTLGQLDQRADVQRQVDDLRADLGALLQTDDLTGATARLDALDASALQADALALQSALEAQNKIVQGTFADLVTARRDRDSVGSDARAAQLDEDRQTLLVQIQAEAQDYLSRQAAILAVDAALRAYRDSHRSSMMQRAGAAFSVLTGGRYSGLGTRPDGPRELLIAQEQGGAAKVVDTLSKGTAFQLYLALRIAGYQELADQRPMVPFIADDIMESFDDDRAGAAFGLLAQMARRGQVIYLTHHAHLCAIARAACPDAQVHDLRAL